MQKSFITKLADAVGFLFIIIVFGSYVIVAQNTIEGTWKTGNKKDKDGKIHLNFERKGQNGNNQTGSSLGFDELQGLSQDQTNNGTVRFRIVREAGTIDCEGAFVDGRGKGRFTFVPDANYLAGMRARGFDLEKPGRSDDEVESRLFAAALINVTTAAADDLRSADLGELDVNDLFKAVIFKIDSQYIAKMKTTGFPGLSLEDLVKSRIFKIDADYVRQVQQMGFAKNDFDNLVQFRIFKITPEYLADLKNAGLSELSAQDIVQCRIFKIDAEFIRSARGNEPNITVQEMVQMKIGVRRTKSDI